MSISSRAQARSKSFCDSPNSAPRKTRTTPCAMLKAAIWNRLVQIDRDRPAKAAAFRTRAERIIETESPGVGGRISSRNARNASRWRKEIRDCGSAIADRLRSSHWTCALGVFRRNDIDLAFAESQRGFDRLDQARAIFLADRDAILNDLHARAEPFDFCDRLSTRTICLSIQTREITLLLEKSKELTRLGFRRNADPESDAGPLWPCEAVAQHLIGDRLRGFRPNFPAATRTKRARDARQEQFQIIVDLRHRADGRARSS